MGACVVVNGIVREVFTVNGATINEVIGIFEALPSGWGRTVKMALQVA